MFRRLYIIGFISLMILPGLYAMDRCSHSIRILIKNPIQFELEDENHTGQSQVKITPTVGLNVSRLSWRQPIPNKKVTVALESNTSEQSSMNARFLSYPNHQFSIGQDAQTLPLPDQQHAGMLRVQYDPEQKDASGIQTIAYTITDAF